MISIYVCDDEESVRHQLKTALEWKILIENYDMSVVYTASTAQELLDTVQDCRCGVYFLDVDLKDGAWDGFTLGWELRRRGPHSGTICAVQEDLPTAEPSCGMLLFVDRQDGKGSYPRGLNESIQPGKI